MQKKQRRLNILIDFRRFFKQIIFFIKNIRLIVCIFDIFCSKIILQEDEPSARGI